MSLIVFGILLMLVQYAAAVPWLLALVWQPTSPEGELKKVSARTGSGATALKPSVVLLGALGCAVVGGVVLGLAMDLFRDRGTLDGMGHGYGSLLQLQVTIDLFVLGFAIILWVWPKGGAVARAAFREGYRQPMFWMLGGLALALLILAPFLPYFTFGEDYTMMKEVGFDTILMAATLFGVLAAAMSITDEIEGRTAVTLMSKPVSRRQFLLGKFLGLFLCSLLIVVALGWIFDHFLLYKRWLDKMDPVVLAPSLASWVERLSLPSEGSAFLRGFLFWLQLNGEVVPGLTMGASMVMVMIAVAVSLATRLPMIINLVTCAFVYVLANLMPVLVLRTKPVDPAKAGPVQKLVHFTAQLFDTLLPGLELFRVRPTLVDEATLSMKDYLQHVGAVSVYGILFTAIVLLLGLVLFEDKDLA
jgi:ABC-type transport system involved in multi-copper enzyme maturation permease subunit